MILIGNIRCRIGRSVSVQLPRRNMVIDPRPNNPQDYGFECTYFCNSTTVQLTRTDGEWYDGPFQFRAYDPAVESVPTFTSTTYIYVGVVDERVPFETTVLVIDPSVKRIPRRAFLYREEIKKCIMYDGVRVIESEAFGGCSAMKVIRLSRTLRRIGKLAFFQCRSLDALFLSSSSIQRIGDFAFLGCTNIRILPLHPSINISKIGQEIVDGCNTLFEVTGIRRYRYDTPLRFLGCRRTRHSVNKKVTRSIIDFYRNMHPLHKTCLDVNVTAQAVNNCIHEYGPTAVSTLDHDRMSPLHILAMNPNADEGSILACFRANMSVAFSDDSRGMTPLDYLRQYHEITDHTLVVADLCMTRYSMMMRSKEDTN